MRLSWWLNLGFLASAAIFLGEAVWRLYVPDDVFPPQTMLLAAGYCLLCVLLLAKSEGLHHSVMLALLFSIFVVLIFRFMVLSFDPTWFLYSLLTSLSSDAIDRALWFTAGSTVAFWLGVKLVTRKAYWPGSTNQDSNGSALFRHRRLLMLGTMILFGVYLGMWGVLGLRVTEGGITYVQKILPVDGMSFVLMYLAVRYWKELTRVEKAALLVSFVLYALGGLAVGQRGLIFGVAVVWFLATALVKPDTRVSIKWGLGGGLLLFFVGPLILGGVLQVRESLSFDEPLLTSVKTVSAVNLGALDLVKTFSNATAGLDALVAAMNYRPPEITSYLSASNLGLATAQWFFPAGVWDVDVLPPAKVFAWFYQGLSPGVRHAGGWPAFSIFYAYLGGYGFVALAGVGAILGLGLVGLSRGGLVAKAFAAYFLSTLTWGLLTGGNPDALLSSLVISWLMVGLLLWGTVALGQSAETKSSAETLKRLGSVGSG